MSSPGRKSQPVVASDEVEEEEVAEAQPSGRGRGSGKAKAKGRGRGMVKAKAKAKGKAKAKAKSRVTEDEGGQESAAAKPKPKAKAKSSFKARVMADVGERDVDEVIAETRANVAKLEASIGQTHTEEQKYEAGVQAARKALADASSKVEQATQKEAIAFEKLKATREATVESGKATRDAQASRGDAERTLAIVELEAACKAKMQHLEDAKKEAQQAAEAAKKALEDVKVKEKEAAAAAKTALAEQKEKEQETLKAINDRQIQVRDESKGAKGAGKGLSKELALEMKEVEKRRAEREKMRIQNMKEAMGGGKPRTEASPGKRATNGAGTPSKVARVEDVD